MRNLVTIAPAGGGLDLGRFRKSNRPSGRGGLDLGLFRKSNRPSGREGWTLDFKKERIHYLGGGEYKVRSYEMHTSLRLHTHSP